MGDLVISSSSVDSVIGFFSSVDFVIWVVRFRVGSFLFGELLLDAPKVHCNLIILMFFFLGILCCLVDRIRERISSDFEIRGNPRKRGGCN